MMMLLLLMLLLMMLLLLVLVLLLLPQPLLHHLGIHHHVSASHVSKLPYRTAHPTSTAAHPLLLLLMLKKRHPLMLLLRGQAHTSTSHHPWIYTKARSCATHTHHTSLRH
jgi:hypothetical protein